MNIGALAQAAGCEVATIRYYEREGLLAPAPRSAGGYRQYATPALERLNFVRHCRSLDMSLADIRQLVAFVDDTVAGCGEVDALVDAHIARVRAKLDALHALEAQLLRLRAKCDAAAADRGAACGIVASLRRAAQKETCACHPPPRAAA